MASFLPEFCLFIDAVYWLVLSADQAMSRLNCDTKRADLGTKSARKVTVSLLDVIDHGELMAVHDLWPLTDGCYLYGNVFGDMRKYLSTRIDIRFRWHSLPHRWTASTRTAFNQGEGWVDGLIWQSFTPHIGYVPMSKIRNRQDSQLPLIAMVTWNRHGSPPQPGGAVTILTPLSLTRWHTLVNCESSSST